MRKAAFMTAAALCLIMALSVLAQAVPPAPGIKVRIEEQQRRIDQGVASGQLTRPEAETLQGNLNRIRSAEARMMKGGMNPREVRRLQQMLDRNSKMIEKEKHNPIRRID